MDRFSIEKLPEFDDHKLVTFFYDKKSGLRAFVVVHNDNLGPATGGTRMWVYKNEIDALRDALNLSKAMTYKCAIAGVPYGGGKGVIIGDPNVGQKRSILMAYAHLTAQHLNSKFRTGTDVGLSDDEVKMMKKENPYLVGAMNGESKLSTGKMAALGTFYGIKGAFEEVLGNEDLRGKKFAIKGLGKTGMELARLLYEQGAEIIGAEIVRSRVTEAHKRFPKMQFVNPAVIHKQKVDVFAPCALGGDLNEKTIKELNCDFVIGTANNQLASPEIGDRLHKLGIVYVPDYAVNGGGLINVVDELGKGGYSPNRVLRRVKEIRQTVRKILRRSQKEKQPPSRIADKMAEEIFRRPVK